MGGGEFDVVMISNYETPQWAENGWLVNLSDYIDKTPDYDQNDFIPSLRDSLSYKGDMYSVPFYGESSFLMYRKDLLEQAGINMPRNPTWQQVADAAAKLNSPDMVGICLRGKPGWGEVLAPLDTVINTFGGRWFDDQWNAQLTSPEVEKAVNFYVDTVTKYGEPGAATSGFGECATQFSQGRAAMWYDATSAVSTVEDPQSSTVVGKVGYALAPHVVKPNSGWLYTWSLGIPKSSDKKDAAWKFISWMTDKNYIKLVGDELGWERVPPGSRLSTYQIPEYQQVSKAYGQLTLDSIEGANPLKPTVQPVPYTGVQFLAIPEFQDLGTRVSQQISAAIAGQQSASDALAAVAEVRRSGRTKLSGEVMTTIAPGSSAADTGAAEHAAQVRKAHDTNISRAEGWRRRGPLLPALIFMIVVTQIPFLFTLFYSTLSWNLVRPGSRRFVGLQNYIDVVGDGTFWQVAFNTVVLIVGTVLISVVLGLLLALLLDRVFLGRGVVRTLLITPFLVTPVAGALMWKTAMLDPVFGIINWVLSPFGVHQIDWVSRFPLTSVMINLVWQWTPFMMLLILAGLTSMPRDILEAGRVDGAGAFQLFRELTLPHLRRFIELGTVLGAIYLVNTFDAIYMMTQGGPGTASANLPFYIYQRAFLGFDIGQAAAMGVIVVIFTMIIASFALRLIFKSFTGKEEAA